MQVLINQKIYGRIYEEYLEYMFVSEKHHTIFKEWLLSQYNIHIASGHTFWSFNSEQDYFLFLMKWS